MGEIRFRAFASGVNEMTFFDNVIVATGELSEGKAWGMFFPSINGKVFLGGYSDPMRFTGLRDRNGKEIYEGDIVQMCRHSDITHKHEKDFISEVRFKHGTFYVIQPRYKIEQPFMSMARPGQSYEVIGNIYENPELLEAQNG